MQRLDRILSEAGVASRKELRAMIRAGRVTVDGAAVTDESRKFDETAVRVTVDGSPVRLRGPVLILLHKPAGYLTAAETRKRRPSWTSSRRHTGSSASCRSAGSTRIPRACSC